MSVETSPLQKQNSIFQASVFIIVGSLSSRIVGFVREILIARNFGASEEYDIFLVATAIPILFVSVLFFAIPGGFVPQYLELKVRESKQIADRFFSKFTNFYTLILLLIALLFFIAAPAILKFYYPTSVASDFAKAVTIFRMATSFIVFGGLFALFKSVLTANRVFFLPAVTPVFHNFSIILFLLIFSHQFGVFALAAGFCVGYIMQYLVMFIQAKAHGVKYQFIFDFRDRLIRNSVPVLIIVMLINILGQFYTLIDRAFNAVLPVGAISGLNYAMVLVQIIINFIGVALGTAILPSISEHLSDNQIDKVEKMMNNSLKFVFMIVIPLAVFIFQNSNDIITIFYKRGSFNDMAVAFSATSLRAYSLGIFAFVVYNVVVNVYYSLREYKYILMSGIIAVLVKILLSFLWVERYTNEGLAVSTSIGVFVNVIIMYAVLNRRFMQLDHMELLIAIVKMALITGIIYMLVSGLMLCINIPSIFLMLLFKIAVWFTMYVGLVHVFRLGNPVKLLGKDIV